MPTVRLLGPVDVVDDHGVVHTPGSPLRCTLLALLAIQRCTVVDTETLLEWIWDGRPPASGLRALRFHISRLRSELGIADLIVTVSSAYRLDADTDLVGLADGLAADTDADTLAALLATRRGDPFLGASACSVLEHERRRLDELTLTITERLYQSRLAADDRSVIGDLTRLCLDHPARESLWALLIRSHYQAGNQADALRAFTTLRINLRDELGVDPSRELQQLQLQILEHDVPNTAPPRELPLLRTSTAFGGNLPSGTMTFLFTDIEGSTKRWGADPEAMRVELAAHDEVLRSAVEVEGGSLFKHTGDGICAAFQSARAAVGAAVSAQRLLGLPVRMGIASGEADLRGDDYLGATLNTAARVMDAGHGGQILVAASTASLVSTVDLVDLGVRRLRDLSGPVQLFQIRAEGLRSEFPALRTVDVVPGNLPVQETSFVGRDDAVVEIVDAVGERRVVSLIGVGGVGKTRLALQSAALLAPRFRDGVWFIELAQVMDRNLVEASVASVFMLQPQPERTWRQVVVDGLQGREALLVIDNCEHVLDDVAALVEALAVCPSVRVLVTSRESLAVAGEWVWRVPSLSRAAAVELFIERADAGSRYRPEDDDVVVIGEICDRLDGIALAIELAAARVRSLGPAQIRDRLDERFRLLTGSRRSIERHQTLRNAVQWSYDLLKPVEQAVLQQVSVLVGGFTLDAAIAITGLDEFDVIDIVDSLVRKSLLSINRSGGEVRYDMLETIRQFAEEALAATGTADVTRDCHAHYFADQADLAFERFESEAERLAFRFVDSEISNLNAAFHWALSRELVDPAVRIAANAHLVARNRLRTETFAWPEQALDLARHTEHRQLPHLLTAACNAANGVGRHDDAVGYGLEAITLNGDSRYDFHVDAYALAGIALFGAGDVEQAMRVVRLGAEHPADAPARGNLLILHLLAHVGGVAMSEQETNGAIARLSSSVVPTSRAGGLWLQATIVADDDVSAAIALCQRALDAETGSRSVEQVVRVFQLGLIARTGDVEAALTGFGHIVNTYQATMGDTYTRNGMNELVRWLHRLGYHDGAARLSGAMRRERSDRSISSHPETVELPETMDAQALDSAPPADAVLDAHTIGELAHQLLAQVRAERLDT